MLRRPLLSPNRASKPELREPVEHLDNWAARLRAEVLVQKCIVAAVLTLFKKWQKDKTDPGRAEADGPKQRGAANVGSTPLARQAANATLLAV